MTPLAPAQKSVFRIRGLITAAFLLIPALFADTAIARETPLPFGLATGAALALGLLLVFVVPARRYRAWAYEATGDELHVRHGIWMQSRTVVPFGRVQHIDVSQGPVERHYGVGTLTLHTAGTRSGAVALPGLEIATAERMRDEIRGKIRQDLV
ncbi:MAG TPA: PH domain-containing protein [Allosphingosinicella sp.]|nr:PH domain-containing protein [Allosphingosinicella sp.]